MRPFRSPPPKFCQRHPDHRDRWKKSDQGLEAASRALAIEPDNSYVLWVVGLNLEQQGRFDETEKHLRKAAFRPVRAPLALAHLLASNGRKKEAFEIAAEVARQVHIPAGQAVVQAGAGNKKAMLDSLERAFRDRDMNLLYVAFDPRFDSYRGDPRFRDLMRKIGIATAQ